MGHYEQPKYVSIWTKGKFECRYYQTFYMVTSYEEGSNASFGQLFRYIQGENELSASMKMTVPVLIEGNDKRPMSFVMTQKEKDKIPKPSHHNLAIETFEQGKYIAYKYSGRRSKKKENRAMEALKNFLEEAFIKVEGPFYFAYYNSPYTPPFLRTNEVIVKMLDEA